MKKAFSKKNLWEKMSSVARATLGRGLGILPPEWLLGRKFRENCKLVHEAQFWSAEKAREYQLSKLREIFELAYTKTDFYHNLFNSTGFHKCDFNSLDGIKRIPVIDKEVVAENMAQMCTKPFDNKGIDFISTGGVSGMPLHFYIDADRSAIEYAYLTISWKRAGYELGMPMAVIRGKVVKPDRNGLYHEYDPILRHHYYSSFHLTDENMARYLEHIKTIGQCFLHVYPSSAVALAKFILRIKKKAPANILGIIAESEIVYPQQREMIEEVFNCRLFSCYGHSEKLILATGCEKSDDYHIWPTYGYFELLDEKDKPVTKPGQRGEIVGTGFINTVMPFIRYRTGDWATYVSDHCNKCGREHITIRDIRGHRTQEVLIVTDGSEISWTAVNMHDETFLHVRQFQFMQSLPGRAVLRIVPTNEFVNEDVDRIQRNLGRKFGDRLNFTVELVESIQLSERGKAVYVEQRIPLDYLNNIKSTNE